MNTTFLFKRTSLISIISISGILLLISLTSCNEEENETDFPLTGSWDLEGGFDQYDPHLINFYNSGYYTVYSKCTGSVNPQPLEIGRYETSSGQVRFIEHIQNGCGGFDDDENPDQVPPNPVSLAFENQGKTAIIADGLRLTKIVNENEPIVGSWELPGGFDPQNPHIITFNSSGFYAVYTDCSNQTDPKPNENLEIGSYSYISGELQITSHAQNGCGGFDNPEDPLSHSAQPISITFSEDFKTLTLVNDQLTLTRIE
ncbi:MAG: hypothetical protein KI791_01645 [Cyclobacteriaceae bacterium]|nr:hypothetical protein [Cyclobacteriaceae bacterium SS2]